MSGKVRGTLKAKGRPDEKLVLVVLLVKGRDEHGRPRECAMGHEDTTFKLQGGEEFITAWVPEKLVNKRTN